MKQDFPYVGFMRLQQVLEIIPISKSAWWGGIRDGKYPKQIKLGPKTSVWRAEDIQALLTKFKEQ